VMYTDGVTEATDMQNEAFGLERLLGVAERFFQRPPQEVISGIRHALEDYTEGKSFADDTTLVVFRVA